MTARANLPGPDQIFENRFNLAQFDSTHMTLSLKFQNILQKK